MLKTRVARPGALQIVTNMNGELAEPLGFEFNHIAVLECIQTAMVGTSCHNVAWPERMDR